ncbi:hypothetical protein CGSHiR3021_01017 [Haemophilus influenzae 22.4-21]|uniref:Uncharacterized protein n=1 Tax=Haemophilus influenzae 22.4-21 TaxID=375063 RepID=A4NZW2_HAEIF|nr:hypothetical protein CGSHiR3021_01017 [Haemophilus influenzae 22.4-21]
MVEFVLKVYTSLQYNLMGFLPTFFEGNNLELV